MKDLILQSVTAQQLDMFIAKPGHALLITAPAGSGKRTTAVKLAAAILELPEDGFINYAYGKLIEPEKTISIGIDVIRELEHFLSLKVPSQAAINRVVVIDGGHLLTIEAQNALLKTLEEPPGGTVIVLTAISDQQLLPTIRSRVQTIQLQTPTKADLQQHFSDATEEDFKRSYAISGGLPGLMHALLYDEDHPLLAATNKARQLLSQTAFERLQMVDELAKKRHLATDVTFILQQMAHTSLQTSQGHAAAKWQTVLAASYKASEALAGNAQPKLVLTNLMLQL